MIKQLLDKRYRITQIVATGGFGRTYLAEDTKRPGNPTCIVKKLKYNSPDTLEKVRELFAREAAILEKLGKHPQIPRLLTYLEKNGEFYLVQDYIEGQTLAQELKAEQNLSEERVINLLSELLSLLEFVHDNGVIHRDINPANIIRTTQDKQLVLIDFGAVKEISALGNQGTIIYTEGYAPPEQYLGNPSICSDIYAVGIIAIQALTGINPNPHSSEGGFEFNIRGEIVWKNKVQLSKDFACILTKMVRQNQKERYQLVKEVLQDLQQINYYLENQKTKNLNSRILLTNPPPFWQKLPLPLSLAFTIATVGIISIPLANKILPLANIGYAPQLPLDGKTVDGILNDNSQVEPLRNTYSDVYLFTGRKDKQVTIEMNSKEFDCYLTILKQNRQVLTFNDDISPENFNSKIVVTLPEDGKYQVIVRASQPGEMGNYKLKASMGSAKQVK